MPRTRSFDKDVALDRAMTLFWRHGYEGTSLDDLTTELGIARPSLYAAFGNKRALFELVLERYCAVGGERIDRALALPSAADAARAFLLTYVDAPAGAPTGCLLVQGALACSPESAELESSVTGHRRVAETKLAQRLARAQREGDLPPGAKPADLARFIATVAHGIAVQSRGGATTAQLRRLVDTAMQAWPAR